MREYGATTADRMWSGSLVLWLLFSPGVNSGVLRTVKSGPGHDVMMVTPPVLWPW